MIFLKTQNKTTILEVFAKISHRQNFPLYGIVKEITKFVKITNYMVPPH